MTSPSRATFEESCNLSVIVPPSKNRVCYEQSCVRYAESETWRTGESTPDVQTMSPTTTQRAADKPITNDTPDDCATRPVQSAPKGTDPE